MAVKKSGYPVEFAEDAFGESPVLAEMLKAVTASASPRILIVADQNVVQRTEGLGSKIGRYVQKHGIALAASPVVLVGGEKIKADNLQSALRVVSALLEARLGSDGCVVAIGGGTLLDIAGYAASQVRGGVKLLRLPTTPAAMMDAAFADYAAVDSYSVKDALRVRSVPAGVVIDVTFAKTVLDGVWRGGFGEAVRQAVAVDATLLKKLAALAPDYCARKPEALAEVVGLTVASRLKKGSTTFAGWITARLESMSGYKLPHGYAVAIGVCVELAYAVERGLVKAKDADQARGLLAACGALDGLAHSRHLLGQADQVLDGLAAWRLTTADAGVVLPTGLGKSSVEEPDVETYRTVLKSFVSSPTEA